MKLPFSFIAPLPVRNVRGHQRTTCARFIPTARAHGVVITGSTRGLGLALAAEFVRSGDHVVVNSRNQDAVDVAVDYLRSISEDAVVHGVAGDVSNPDDVDLMLTQASLRLKQVDCVVCNAGSTPGRVPHHEADGAMVAAAVGATLTGALLVTRSAIALMRKQQSGHVFLMEGAGSDGLPTPFMATYGACKRALPHLVASLRTECRGTPVRVHKLSPGMVLTGLLLQDGTTPTTRRVFNILAEESETVARYLVPRISRVVRDGSRNTEIRFLTIPGGVFKMIVGFLLGWRRNRFFDEDTGERVEEGSFDENGVRVVINLHQKVQIDNQNRSGASLGRGEQSGAG